MQGCHNMAQLAWCSKGSHHYKIFRVVTTELGAHALRSELWCQLERTFSTRQGDTHEMQQNRVEPPTLLIASLNAVLLNLLTGLGRECSPENVQCHSPVLMMWLASEVKGCFKSSQQFKWDASWWHIEDGGGGFKGFYYYNDSITQPPTNQTWKEWVQWRKVASRLHILLQHAINDVSFSRKMDQEGVKIRLVS